jgi:hypothetical protein
MDRHKVARQPQHRLRRHLQKNVADKAEILHNRRCQKANAIARPHIDQQAIGQPDIEVKEMPFGVKDRLRQSTTWQIRSRIFGWLHKEIND